MKNIVFYHKNCLDGFTAAWAASKFLPEDTEFIPKNPKAKSALQDNIDGNNVYVVDMSFDRETLFEIKKRSKSLVLLDHHKTAYNDLKDLKFCTFDMNRSGAMMSWDYFSKGKKAPLLVELVQDRDLWRWEIEGSDIAMLTVDSFEKTFEHWDYLNELSMADLLDMGSGINRTNKIDLERYVRWAQFTDFFGYEVPISLCLNPRIKSDLGNILSKNHPFAVLWTPIGNNKVSFSLRSSDEGVDVSEIALKMDGGGHRNAAGCLGDMSLVDGWFNYDYSVAGLTYAKYKKEVKVERYLGEGWQLWDYSGMDFSETNHSPEATPSLKN